MIQEYLNSVDKFIIIGDRVLIKPRDMETRTKSGLVLPATVKEKEEIQSGYIIKTGPGYPIPSQEIDEPWKDQTSDPKYIGMQAKEGDLAIFLKSRSHEIEFENEKFLIVPHAAILLLIRDEHHLE
ncbi:MAG: co-chaperone GroES [Bacteroidetes bacterium]|jgi:co-chaperonin GroES (HSP10)|uniref:co-chaperone GroES n=1 Tax=Rhodohalobacter sp. 614A TaxID=2908649 RepID=UPI001F316C8E|nr:co-chaperone GroES family protein [Rhodohalobacter sp. 614A]NBC65110.1 co-chaperone GroES [Bacteroidota bacterium]